MTQKGYHEDVKYKTSGMTSLDKFRLYAFPEKQRICNSLRSFNLPNVAEFKIDHGND